MIYMLIKNNISIISTFSSGLSSSIYVSLNVHRLFFRDGGGWPQISAKRKLLVDQTIFAGQHIRYGHRNRPRTPPSANLSPKRFRSRVVSLNVHLLVPKSGEAWPSPSTLYVSTAKFTRGYGCASELGLRLEGLRQVRHAQDGRTAPPEPRGGGRLKRPR